MSFQKLTVFLSGYATYSSFLRILPVLLKIRANTRSKDSIKPADSLVLYSYYTTSRVNVEENLNRGGGLLLTLG